MTELTSHVVAQLIGPVTTPATTTECRIVAVGTIDGSASLDGNSQKLGNDLDAALVHGLRHWSDCILVGAGTVRAENYSGVIVPAAIQHQRRDRGQQPIPPLAIVSRSLHFPPSAKIFNKHPQPHIIITDIQQAAAANVEKLQSYGWDIIDVPSLAAPRIVAALTDRGFQRIVSEGGPQLNAELLAANLVSKIHLTLDPRARHKGRGGGSLAAGGKQSCICQL